ncbi:hypothetical protein A3L11_09255 [Thermococcus siculi]|uniref:Oxidoreductase molybdopterin-binding domain-containing protein n=1 Tax=Thermococcus siculi TaxID=72803 RepID=A0A2Z2MUD6_9EURY|nr:hypothetical protein A3L11_09255 [Thermococcus siculi]
MRKGIFALIVIILLVGGTYFIRRDGESTASREFSTEQGVIQVRGLVERPYNITYDDLASLPSRNVTAVLYCVDSPNR